MGEKILKQFICEVPKDSYIDLSSYSVIGKDSFRSTNLENVFLRDAKVIEESAFENNKNLKLAAWLKVVKCFSVVIVETTVDLEDDKTKYILKMISIDLEDGKSEEFIDEVSNTERVIIQKAAFKGCERLETVIFPKNECVIEKDAFAQCKSLRTIVFPGVETEIIDDPFIGCKDLTIVCNKDDYKLQAYARAHSFRIIELN